VLLSPDGAHAWWGGAWARLNPGALSPGRQWVMLDGQWRPVRPTPPTEEQSPTIAQPELSKTSANPPVRPGGVSPDSDPAARNAPTADYSGPAAAGQPGTQQPPNATALPQQPYPPGFPPIQQNYGPGPFAPGVYRASGPSSETNGFAIASLIFGILWLLGLGSLLAVIFGHVAHGQNKRTHRGGNGLATAGLVLGYIGLAIVATFAISVLAAVNSNSSQAANRYQASMKSDLRTVAQEVEVQNVDTQDYTQTTFGDGQATLGGTVSGPGQTVGTDTVNLSAGNTITWVGGTATAFCLEATSSDTSATWYYSSDNGGITSTSCTADAP
jgi:hypothetical protein